MKARVKRSNRQLYQQRADKLRRALPRVAQQAAREGQAHAHRALNLGVYGTAPGEYQRTGRARDSLSFTAQANGTSGGVQGQDTAEYASLIEYGSGPYALSQQQLDAYLEAMPESGMLNFGRSGQAYLLPQPFVSVGIRKSQAVMRGEVQRLMVQLWK